MKVCKIYKSFFKKKKHPKTELLRFIDVQDFGTVEVCALFAFKFCKNSINLERDKTSFLQVKIAEFNCKNFSAEKDFQEVKN